MAELVYMNDIDRNEQSPQLNPEELLIQKEITVGLKKASLILTPNEQDVLMKYFGFVSEEQNFSQIARMKGRSASRIRQIYLKALRKLRHPKCFFHHYVPEYAINYWGSVNSISMDVDTDYSVEWNSQ